MIKLNETNSAIINVLGEDELTQVVGGNCHRRRGGGYGRHCGGGWRRRERDSYCGGYEKSYDDYEGSDSSDSSDSYEDESSSNNVQIASVDVTVNIAQVQG
jgi:hypothetical protein